MKALLSSFFAMMLLVPAMAQADDGGFTHFGTVLRGYDAVAYQTESRAVEGDSNFAVNHDGLTYLFASKANADTFKANPSKYIPAYNGYCAYGVTKGKKFPTDPQAFKVVNGVLYMNLNKKVQQIWLEDVPGNIADADKKWGTIKDTHPDNL